MQTTILYSLIALAAIALIIFIDLYRAKKGRSKPNKVEQIPHAQLPPPDSLKKVSLEKETLSEEELVTQPVIVQEDLDLEEKDVSQSIHMGLLTNGSSHCWNNRRSLLNSRNDLGKLMRLTRSTIDNIYEH